MNTMHKPGISITAGTVVTVDEAHTLEQLSHVSGRLAQLLNDGEVVSLAKLTTAVGDLSASVVDGLDSPGEFADELADVVIHTMKIAHHHGIDGLMLQHAIQRRMTDLASAGIGAILNGAMSDRGFGNKSGIAGTVGGCAGCAAG